MHFYDILILLDGKMKVTGFEFLNPGLSEMFRVLLGSAEGESFDSLFP